MITYAVQDRNDPASKKIVYQEEYLSERQQFMEMFKVALVKYGNYKLIVEMERLVRLRGRNMGAYGKAAQGHIRNGKEYLHNLGKRDVKAQIL